MSRRRTRSRPTADSHLPPDNAAQAELPPLWRNFPLLLTSLLTFTVWLLFLAYVALF